MSLALVLTFTSLMLSRSVGFLPFRMGQASSTGFMRALFGSSSSNATSSEQDTLVEQLAKRGTIRSPRVASVMKMVDRKFFANTSPQWLSYEDHPQPIGYGQTISAPHMHATCLELLQDGLVEGARALDVGSGSGYLVACFALMVGPTGFVLGIEKVPELAKQSIENIQHSNPELVLSGPNASAGAAPAARPGCTLAGSGVNWQVLHGNVLSEALQGEEPFNVIHVGAAAEEIPKELLRVLKPGGRMVIPVGPRWDAQALTIVDRDLEGRFSTRRLMGVTYVPLTRPGEMNNDVF